MRVARTRLGRHRSGACGPVVGNRLGSGPNILTADEVPADARAAYLDGLTTIDPGLTVNEDRAISRATNICLDIEQGKDEATVINNTVQRLSGGTRRSTRPRQRRPSSWLGRTSAAERHRGSGPGEVASTPRCRSPRPGQSRGRGTGEARDDGGAPSERNAQTTAGHSNLTASGCAYSLVNDGACPDGASTAVQHCSGRR